MQYKGGISLPKYKTPAISREENKSHHHSKEELKKMKEFEQELQGHDDLLYQAPEYLSEVGKEYYNFIVNELKDRGILSNLDKPLIEQTADCLDKMFIADSILNKEGMFIDVVNSRGETHLKEHPAVKTKQAYLNQFRFCSSQLGMSPSSRAQMAQFKLDAKQESEKPVNKILSKRKQ